MVERHRRTGSSHGDRSISRLQDAVHYALRADPATASESTFEGSRKGHGRGRRNRSWLTLAKQEMIKYGFLSSVLHGKRPRDLVRLIEEEARSRGWDARSDTPICTSCGKPTYGNAACRDHGW